MYQTDTRPPPDQYAPGFDAVKESRRDPAPPTAEAELLELAQRPPLRTYSLGMDPIDALMAGGAAARQLVVVSAPTGAGKTGLALCWGKALSRHMPVLYVSTELEPDEIAARLAAQAMNARPGGILSHAIDPRAAAHAVAGVALHVVYLDAYAEADPIGCIRARAEAVRTVTGSYPAIVVDYLQQLVTEDPDRRRVTVGRVASELRRMAQTFDVPVLAVSSVSRAFYGGARKAMDGEQDPRAWLASAKESGDVEYHAAVVVYLDVGEADFEGVAPARAIVAKSRRGRTGMVGLRFVGPTGEWYVDDGAAGEMGPARREAEIDRRVLEVVRGMRIAPTRTELRGGRVPGHRGQVIDAAVRRLLDAGELEEREEPRPRSDGRMRRVTVLGVPGGADA